MDQSEEIVRLLTEIRDGQREYLAEYRKNAERSLSLTESVAERQRRLTRLLLPVLLFVLACGVLMAALTVPAVLHRLFAG
ncbi:MAG: hypothetical protein WD847_07310 [Pirellulales bacterium]